MKIKMFLFGVLSGIILVLFALIINVIIHNSQSVKFKTVNSNSYIDVMNQYVPEIAVKSADSALKIGSAYINDIYYKDLFTISTIEYDKENGFWIVRRYGTWFDPLKVVVIDEKTGKIVSAIGYKN